MGLWSSRSRDLDLEQDVVAYGSLLGPIRAKSEDHRRERIGASILWCRLRKISAPRWGLSPLGPRIR